MWVTRYANDDQLWLACLQAITGQDPFGLAAPFQSVTSPSRLLEDSLRLLHEEMHDRDCECADCVWLSLPDTEHRARCVCWRCLPPPMTGWPLPMKYGISYDPATERVVLSTGDRECPKGVHPPPSTLTHLVCQRCGACRAGPDFPVVYVEELDAS